MLLHQIVGRAFPTVGPGIEGWLLVPRHHRPGSIPSTPAPSNIQDTAGTWVDHPSTVQFEKVFQVTAAGLGGTPEIWPDPPEDLADLRASLDEIPR